MIIPDVNMLLYAELDAFPEHRLAKAWWEQALNGERQVGIPLVCLFGFIRTSTNRRVFETPLSITNAIDRTRRWLAQPNAEVLVPGHRYLEIAFSRLAQLGTGTDLATDTQIAAHAIELNGEVHSNDGHFSRFEGLRWVNPLIR